MKDETFDKIINKLGRAYLYAQVIFSWCIILWGALSSVRCIIEKSDAIYLICFLAIAYVGHHFMLRASIAELREARKSDAHE